MLKLKEGKYVFIAKCCTEINSLRRSGDFEKFFRNFDDIVKKKLIKVRKIYSEVSKTFEKNWIKFH